MSTTKKPTKSPEELHAALQKLIAQSRKEGMIRAADLAAQLEAMVGTLNTGFFAISPRALAVSVAFPPPMAKIMSASFTL